MGDLSFVVEEKFESETEEERIKIFREKMKIYISSVKGFVYSWKKEEL